MNNEIKQILEAVSAGNMSVDEALLKVKRAPFEDIGYAKVDLHRKIRQGAAEVIYGAGKTPEQICGIVQVMRDNGQDSILITRMSPEAAQAVAAVHPMEYHAEARVGILGALPQPSGLGKIVVATGGTAMCRWRRRRPSPPRYWAMRWYGSMMWGWQVCTGPWLIWTRS